MISKRRASAYAALILLFRMHIWNGNIFIGTFQQVENVMLKCLYFKKAQCVNNLRSLSACSCAER